MSKGSVSLALPTTGRTTGTLPSDTEPPPVVHERRERTASLTGTPPRSAATAVTPRRGPHPATLAAGVRDAVRLLRKDEPPVRPRELAGMDLSERAADSLRATVDPESEAQLHLASDIMPKIRVTVSTDDRALLSHYDEGKENFALQQVQATAFEAMQASALEIGQFASDLIEKHGGLPQLSTHQRRELEQTCRQVAKAQQGRIDALVGAAIDKQHARRSALHESNGKFAFKLTARAIGLAATTVTAIAAPPLAVFSAVEAASLIGLISNFATGRAMFERRLRAADRRLDGHHSEDRQASAGFAGRTRWREVASALGVMPVVNSVHGQRRQLTEFLARSERGDGAAARRRYAQLNDTLVAMQALQDRDDLSDREQRRLAKAEASLTDLLDSLATITQQLKQDDDIHDEFKQRCDGYEEKHPDRIGTIADGVETAMLVRTLATAARHFAELIIAVV